jgi:uncharacterized protein YutE (UPF0331/DUF86 family)
VCLDISRHIIADRGLRVPTTYGEALEVLADASLLDSARRDTMVRLGNFRNLLVHEYARIDPAMLGRILRDHLKDLPAFKPAVMGWI